MGVYFTNTAFKRPALFVYSTKLYEVAATTKGFVNSLIHIKSTAHLVYINKLYCLTNFNFSGNRLLP